MVRNQSYIVKSSPKKAKKKRKGDRESVRERNYNHFISQDTRNRSIFISK